jgi:hypothetical protein
VDVYHVGFLGFNMFFSSLKRRNEACVEGEVKGEAGHKWGPSRSMIRRIRVLGPSPIPGHTQTRAPRNSEFPDFGS